MSLENPYAELEKYIDQRGCPGTSKLLIRRIHEKGSISMTLHQFKTDSDVIPLKRIGIIQMEDGERVTFTDFANSMTGESHPKEVEARGGMLWLETHPVSFWDMLGNARSHYRKTRYCLPTHCFANPSAVTKLHCEQARKRGMALTRDPLVKPNQVRLH